ncbi:MAG: glucose-1-phosphate cytidylyltransferase [Flavobacterium sp.]|uniref:glucose-1-phosphate cytidylyltransferase n=1 Tax=Flavobacterium sp. TaxID=239 RepID=UPI003BE64437
MKAVILAGGLGTRISEETGIKPKPMVEIGSKPILWHIMKIYSSYGINDFIICCGYKGYIIKEYFSNYFIQMSDIKCNLKENHLEIIQNFSEPWNITLVETGDDTMTGGRLKRVRNYLKNDDIFCFTYGDGLGNVNISELIEFHKTHGGIATITATRPPGRYGAMVFGQNNIVDHFKEKPEGDGSWINGGFFVLNTSVIDFIDGDHSSWESDSLTKIAEAGQLFAYKHYGFWQPMDTLREKNMLNELWKSGNAPWKTW